jgi:hypothetical protein
MVCYLMQLKTNDWLAQENHMFEDYLRRVYPNMDLSAVTEKKQAKGKKKSEQKKDGFVPLSAEEKSNICSHQLDAMLQKIGEVEKKGQDEISEVRCTQLQHTVTHRTMLSGTYPSQQDFGWLKPCHVSCGRSISLVAPLPLVAIGVQIKTMLEEVDVRMAESKKETHEFKRDIIIGAENPHTGATMADKFVKCVPLHVRLRHAGHAV